VAVLEMIGASHPARQIARALHISPKTVDSHCEHIKAKLRLGDDASLTRFAINWVSEHCRD
jgi:DNA-binding CsgD family transcriptional regulator